MQKSRRDSTLAGAWQAPARRILFFTYRFNFRWFHDCVLTLARRRSIEGVQVDVVATQSDADGNRTARGDLYALDEWAKWQRRLRIHYLPPRRHLFHNKFILVELANGEVELGIGSSNLTPNGWSRNFETWTWSRSSGLHACAAFLRYLRGLPHVNGAIFEPWIQKITRPRSDTCQWLWQNKTIAVRRTLQAIRKEIGRPATVRIVSPYFDAGSQDVLHLALTETGADRANAPIEIWIDGSAMVGRAQDYEVVATLAARYGNRCKVNKVVSQATPKRPSRPIPLHAKVIELVDQDGKVQRLIGSANFTGAAWLDAWNTESLHLESDRKALQDLLPAGQLIAPLTRQSLRALQNSAADNAEDEPTGKPTIYSAAFDETRNPRELTVCYSATAPLDGFTIEAAFDKSRDELPTGKTQRDAIVAAFQARRNWRTLPAPDGILKLALQLPTPPPELARIVLRFTDGVRLEAPIELAIPDFSKRDPSSGIPIASSLEAILGKGMPIVPPRVSRPITELPGADDEYDDDVPVIVPEDKLASDPAYKREPLAVRIAKLMSKLRTDRSVAKRVLARCDELAALPSTKAERSLLAAVRRIASSK